MKFQVIKRCEVISYQLGTKFNGEDDLSGKKASKDVCDAIGDGYEIIDKSVICTGNTACIVWILRKAIQ